MPPPRLNKSQRNVPPCTSPFRISLSRLNFRPPASELRLDSSLTKRVKFALVPLNRLFVCVNIDSDHPGKPLGLSWAWTLRGGGADVLDGQGVTGCFVTWAVAGVNLCTPFCGRLAFIISLDSVKTIAFGDQRWEAHIIKTNKRLWP